MKKFVQIAVLGFLSSCFALPAEQIERVSAPDEDARLTFLQLCSKYGYKCEDYKLQTDDGYVLTIHRIAQSPKCSTTTNKEPAFLQHGLLSSSFDWVITGPGKALGYLLADSCYDVWLGNFRGNVHSREHISHKPNSDEFWEFSWHEIGSYDLPAQIDFILKKTNKPKLIHVGHSQGTTTFYIMCQFRPEMCSKIHASFQLAPVAHLCNTQSTMLKMIASNWPIIGWVLDVIGLNEFLPSSTFLSTVGGYLCSAQSPFSPICTNALFMLVGWNSDQLDATQLPMIMGHTPAGSSTNQVLHYAQCMASCKFQQFDHGIANLVYYGSLFPPSYKLEKTCAPVYMFMGKNDNFSSLKDCATLWSKIPKSQQGGQYIISHDKFNHLDFLFAKDAKTLVYKELCKQMAQFSGVKCAF